MITEAKLPDRVIISGPVLATTSVSIPSRITASAPIRFMETTTFHTRHTERDLEGITQREAYANHGTDHGSVATLTGIQTSRTSSDASAYGAMASLHAGNVPNADITALQTTTTDKTSSRDRKKATAGSSATVLTSDSGIKKTFVETGVKQQLSDKAITDVTIEVQPLMATAETDTRREHVEVATRPWASDRVSQKQFVETTPSKREASQTTESDRVGLTAQTSTGDKLAGTGIVNSPFVLTLSADKYTVKPGELVELSLKWTNTSERSLRDPEIAIHLPRGLEMIRATESDTVALRPIDVVHTPELIAWKVTGSFEPGQHTTTKVLVRCGIARGALL